MNLRCKVYQRELNLGAACSKNYWRDDRQLGHNQVFFNRKTEEDLIKFRYKISRSLKCVKIIRDEDGSATRGLGKGQFTFWVRLGRSESRIRMGRWSLIGHNVDKTEYVLLVSGPLGGSPACCGAPYLSCSHSLLVMMMMSDRRVGENSL